MGFLKYIDRPFYWCQKIVKKWWLSQSYLELKKLKLRVEQSHVLLVITSKNQLILMFLEWNYGFLKVHSQGFVMIPKSGQEVMITMVKSHFKNRLTFARAPCSLPQARWVNQHFPDIVHFPPLIYLSNTNNFFLWKNFGNAGAAGSRSKSSHHCAMLPTCQLFLSFQPDNIFSIRRKNVLFFVAEKTKVAV